MKRFLAGFFTYLYAISVVYAGTAAYPWANGPTGNRNFFPIAVWWQQPEVTGHTLTGGTNEAQQAALQNINIFLGLTDLSVFGTDGGAVAALNAENMQYIGAITVTSSNNTGVNSTASWLSLASGSIKGIIGYNGGDEPTMNNGSPTCGGTMDGVPAIATAVTGYDTTRPIFFNFQANAVRQEFLNTPCKNSLAAATQAVSVASFDLYPNTIPWYGYTGSDFNTTPFDALYVQSLQVDAFKGFMRAGQAQWAFIEAPNSDYNFSNTNSQFSGSTTSGSTTLVNASGFSVFTSAWVGLTVSGTGIQGSTTISSITDSTHAVMSKTATNTSTRSVTLSGGDGGGSCRRSTNICLANGNQHHDTPEQSTAMAWNSIIAGAMGIEWFCHDTSSTSFCLGDPSGSANGSAASVDAISYIDGVILQYAYLLNAPTLGYCNMWSYNTSTGAKTKSTSCSGGILGLSTSNTVPGIAMVKNGDKDSFVFVQTNQKGAADLTVYLQGYIGGKVTVIYDSASKWHPASTSVGRQLPLNGNSKFTDSFSFDYQTKIYRVHPANCVTPCKWPPKRVH